MTGDQSAHRSPAAPARLLIVGPQGSGKGTQGVRIAEAFGIPAISTGVYGYPRAQAAKVAARAVVEVLHRDTDTFDQILFVCFDEDNRALYDAAVRDALSGD